MTPEDVTHFLPGEAPQEPQQAAQPQAEAPQAPPPQDEVELLEIAGRQVPANVARQFAEALGEDPDNFVNRASLMYRYNSDMSRQGRENAMLRAELAKYRQMQEAPQAPPQRAPQAPQPQYDPNSDPVNFLAHTFQTRQEALERKFDAFIQAQQQTAQQQAMERESQVLSQAYSSWAQAKKAQGFKNIPSLEEMDQMAADLELGQTSLPYDKAFEVAWNVYYGDQVAQTAQKAAVDNLRNPKAKIVVPGATAPAPPPAPSSADQLSGLKWGDALDFLPESRR